uniref:ATP synthase complex subunit 8 n=1 Tax=Vermileo comstocki TaxID=2841214 RepID=A0A8K1KXV3_9DIPT|nr:ATP synthase F0 subunit 8 [Vermileo comstocki]
MPQMAPISWLMLMIIFSITFIMFNMMNYFFVLPPQPSSKTSQQLLSKSLIWKW